MADRISVVDGGDVWFSPMQTSKIQRFRVVHRPVGCDLLSAGLSSLPSKHNMLDFDSLAGFCAVPALRSLARKGIAVPAGRLAFVVPFGIFMLASIQRK